MFHFEKGFSLKILNCCFYNEGFPAMFSLIIACLLGAVSADVVLNTNNGPIRGVSSLKDDVEAFLGIPYAEPPVEDLRFARAIPKAKWKDVYNASKLGPPCLQFSVKSYYFMLDIANMSEDCLYLNIWAPLSKPTSGLRPIIIFVHPGDFATGSSTSRIYDGSHLASRGDIVVASFNYRLGTLGYFLAYTKGANGNMGEFDKIMAIKWIKENAKYFSGDPENISLMGADSVSGLLVSPLSQDLFRRAIILSGSMIHPFFLDDNSRLFKNSEMVASITGCSNKSTTLKSNPASVVSCLRHLAEKDLIKAQRTFSNLVGLFPRVNDDYLPKSSVDLYREGKFDKEKDVIFGITKDEGSMMLFAAEPEYVELYGKGVKMLSKYRALVMSREVIFNTRIHNASEIIDYYMKHVKRHDTFGYLKVISDIVGDFMASCGTVFNADIVSLKGNRVFFYKLGFRPTTTSTPDWIGATHLDELQYIFGNSYHGTFTPEEIELSHNIMDRWAAFLRKGNPNMPGHMPWLRYSYHTPVYLNIGQEEESIQFRPNERCEVWRKHFKADIDADLVRYLRNLGTTSSSSSRILRHS